MPDVEPLVGASAEAPAAHYLDRMGRPAVDDALDIPHWEGVYDLDACLAVLDHFTVRARSDLAVAS